MIAGRSQLSSAGVQRVFVLHVTLRVRTHCATFPPSHLVKRDVSGMQMPARMSSFAEAAGAAATVSVAMVKMWNRLFIFTHPARGAS